MSCSSAYYLEFAAEMRRRITSSSISREWAGGGGGEEKKVLEFERRGNIVRVCYSKL